MIAKNTSDGLIQFQNFKLCEILRPAMPAPAPETGHPGGMFLIQGKIWSSM